MILSGGVLDGKVGSAKTSPERTVGWLMEVNLDHLAMALFGIPDIRLLWSSDARFKEQFSVLKVRHFYEQLQCSTFCKKDVIMSVGHICVIMNITSYLFTKLKIYLLS